MLIDAHNHPNWHGFNAEKNLEKHGRAKHRPDVAVLMGSARRRIQPQLSQSIAPNRRVHPPRRRDTGRDAQPPTDLYWDICHTQSGPTRLTA